MVGLRGWLIGLGVALAVGAVLVWAFRGSPTLTTDVAKVDTALAQKLKSDEAVAVITNEIRALRLEAAEREKQALKRQASADVAAQESARLQVRVGRLEDQWVAYPPPQTLPEARKQLETAVELIQGYKTELTAKDSEIINLRQAIQELTAATHAQDIALAKAEVRDEMRKEMLAQFATVLEGIREDLKAERAQRARERWLGLIPIVGAVLLLFGGHAL